MESMRSFLENRACMYHKDILENFSLKFPYSALMPKSLIQGNKYDKTRHFHLNFATDTQTEYISEKELFTPLTDTWESPVYEQSLFHLAGDSFSMDDLFPFKGPCVAYLSRIIIAPEDMECFLNIGYSSPFSMWLNGELITSRDNFDNWTAENVHLDGVKLKSGENKLVVRMTRANSDTKMNVQFTLGIACKEHIVWLASKNPYKF